MASIACGSTFCEEKGALYGFFASVSDRLWSTSSAFCAAFIAHRPVVVPGSLHGSGCPLAAHSSFPSPYIWHTAPESHAKVNEYINSSGFPCWRVHTPNGLIEEFGCTSDSRHTYIDSSGVTVVWRWDLDLLIDRYGNQMHVTYQDHTNADGSVRDAVLSTIEYDDPNCHNASSSCSSWNPQVKLVFDASRIIPNSQITNPDSPCLNWAGTNYYRCDDPVDLSGSGGLPVPKVLNTFALKDLKVEVQGNLLREYVFYYDQNKPQTITDPVSGQSESISGYLILTKIVQEGTNGNTVASPSAPPVVNLSYISRNEHYEDLYRLATPTNNCSPAGWSPKDGNGNCYLWSRTYSTYFLSTIDNGRGWHENISWVEARNNTQGVDSGAINDPTTCNGQETSTNKCGRADDQSWSRIVVKQIDAYTTSSTTPSSTWQYQYYLQQNLPANFPGTACSSCHQGFSWGNQNDADYADYYNGQFMSFYQVEVTQPDGSYQLHTYAGTPGWGLADSSITCYLPAPQTCSVASYFNDTSSSVLAATLSGHEQEEDDYDSSGKLLQVQSWIYAHNCPPTGVANSANSGGSSSDPGGSQLISELDENNPVVVCDPRVTHEDLYLVDGVTDINGYLSDARVVHKHIDYQHDTDDQGVSAYDYGNTTNIAISGNDLGSTDFITHQTFYPHDDISGGIYLTDLPAIVQTQDGTNSQSGTPVACSQYIYGANSSVTTSPTLPGATQAQAYTVVGSNGCTGSANLITTKASYDASGNPITTIDGDNHLGCTSGSNTYSTCATYDSLAVHIVKVVNANNQTITSSYDSSASGGFGEWLTSQTDVNGQVTSYQYDVLGRLTAVIRPGDSSSSPTITYTYINTCSNGGTGPCIELDTAVRYTVGGPTSTTQQWFDGWGHLVETQTPGPSSGKAILTYTVYDGMGRPITRSLPYSVASGQGYLAPDLTKARTVTSYDGLGRSLGSVTYSDATTIVLESSLSYTVAQGVTGISSESGNPYEQTITLDAYNHQSISYSDALGRTRYSQVFSGTSSPYSVVRTVGYSYDVPGDLTQTQTYDSTGTVQASYNATYDALGRLTGFNDSDLGSCTNSNMPASCSSSSDTAWKFTYDADNNELSQTDARNQTTYTSYDLLNRPLCRGTSSAQVNPCQSSAYARYFYDSYDNSSNPGLSFPSGCSAPTGSYASDPIGHVTAEAFSSSAGSGWRCYGYDQRGQLDQSMLSVTADSTTTTQTMNLAYNDQGELTQLVYGGSTPETVTSTYDANGYFQSAYFGTPSTPDPVNFLVGQASYTDWGGLSGLAIGGSGPKNSAPTPLFSASYSYDGIQRLQSSSASENGTTFWNQTRTYDNVGNILQLNTTIPTLSGGTKVDNQSFCYDALDRLVWAGDTGTPTGGDHCGNAPTGTTISSAYQQSFSYDSLDRMSSGPMGTVGYSNGHVHAANTLSSIPNKYATYDDMGNMTCRNVDTTSAHACGGSNPSGALMTYDNEGRLATWTAPSGTTASDSFLYDNEGNRVLQRTSDSNGITDIITFDGFAETAITGSTTTLTRYYSAAGQRIAMRQGNTLSYLLSDGLGSTTIALSSTGSVTAVQLFAPYGSSRYSKGSMPTDYNFTGQRLDRETGLLYYGARYYDPLSGRFTQADLRQNNVVGMDPYAYVGENPESRTDPTGHYYTNGTPITQQGGAIGYIGNTTITTVTNDGVGSVWTADDQFAYTQGSLAISTYTYQQAAQYGGYDPLTDAANSPGAKLSHELGLDALQQTWSNPHASWQDKLGAVGQFLLTNANNALQLAMIFGGPEDEAVDAGGEEGLSLLDEVAPCGGLSFASATPVATSHGEQAIGTMKVGEKVWAYNPRTRKMELQAVQHVWINHDNDLVDLTLTTTSFQQGKAVRVASEVIHTNQKHPFLTREKGFLPVGQLKLGMHVRRADGQWGVVTGWKVVAGTQVMYNLEVAQDHTFTVGVGEWVVHNCGGDLPNGWEKLDYGADNNPAISDFTHIDEAGNRLEATFYHDTGELHIPWMDSLSQAKTNLPGLIDWLGDSVEVVKGYVTDNLATHFSPGSRGLASINRMFSSLLEGNGFSSGTIESEGNRIWIVFRRLQP